LAVETGESALVIGRAGREIIESFGGPPGGEIVEGEENLREASPVVADGLLLNSQSLRLTSAFLSAFSRVIRGSSK
jgi:hypothetical protein